jgi:hypothetical protein
VVLCVGSAFFSVLRVGSAFFLVLRVGSAFFSVLCVGPPLSISGCLSVVLCVGQFKTQRILYFGVYYCPTDEPLNHLTPSFRPSTMVMPDCEAALISVAKFTQLPLVRSETWK